MSSITQSTRYLVPLVVVVVLGTVAAAQMPSPALLVVLRADKAGAVLGIVDPVAGKIVGRVPTGQDPHGVAVSADGKLAFVANTNAHNQTRPDGEGISVIDLAARKEIHRVPIGEGARPHDIHVVGGKVYFTAEGYKAIGRYDPQRNRIEWMLGLGQKGPHMMAVSQDMNTVFAANNGSSNVSLIEGALAGPPDWKVSVIPVGKGAEGIDFSPDGKEVWTANEEDGGVSIIDVVKQTPQHVDLQTKHANRLKFTPDGKRVLVLDRETAELVVVDAATRTAVKRIKLSGETPGEAVGVFDFVVVPDSSRAYVTVAARTPTGHSYIGVIDLKALAVTRRIETETSADGVAWAETKK